MRLFQSGLTGRGAAKRNQKIWRATASVESLERRQLMSVTAHTLRGPLDAGDTWTYQETSTDNQSVVATNVQTVIGPTTFQGNQATEVDSVTTNNQNSDSSTNQQFTAFDSSGDYVQFGV